MSRTANAWTQDTAHTTGLIWYGAGMLDKFSANLVLTRNALGDYSLNRTASGAETYQVVATLTDLYRLLTSASPVYFQEQFGTAAGTSGYPAAAPGYPPFTGATQLVPPTGPPAKGIQVNSVTVVYQVGVADLSAASLSLNRIVYANNVANAITNIPIAATALPLTAAGDATGPYLATRAVTTPAFENTQNSNLELEFAVTLANTGTLRIYGMGLNVSFNYN